MIKDKNSLTDVYKSYAFVEYFDLEDAKKALDALNKGEIKLREEALSGNYSTKTEDKNNSFNYENNLSYNHGVNIFINILYISYFINIE
jgi:RNA recognition motif-containing protein